MASALRIEFEVEPAHMLHRNCDMQMNLARESPPQLDDVCLMNPRH